MLFSKLGRFHLSIRIFTYKRCILRNNMNFNGLKTTVSSLLLAKNYSAMNKLNYEKALQFNLKMCLDDAMVNDGATHQGILVSDDNINQFCNNYKLLSDDEKQNMLLLICKQYGVKHTAISEACQWFKKNSNSKRDELTLLKTEERLRAKLQPTYVYLFMLVGRLENGVKFLTDLRLDVLNAISKSKNDLPNNALLRDFSNHLKNTLSVWFSVGLLQRKQINWQTSADILEKIAQNEAVHRVVSWLDLRHRLGANRKCYAFFHTSMPREPLVILHVALTTEISDNITDIMDREGPDVMSETSQDKNTAIFYSITSTQKGLQGIEFGVHMIRGVVQELSEEFPNIKQFSSLSPIPKFRDWLLEKLTLNFQNDELERIFSPKEISALSKCFEISQNDIPSHLAMILNDRNWMSEEKIAEVLKPVLMRLCANFLFNTKRRGYAFDPVANFHLHNGATLWRINWMADPSVKGNRESCGLMANYRYYLENVEGNSKRYIIEKHVSVSPQITTLLAQDLKNKL